MANEQDVGGPLVAPGRGKAKRIRMTAEEADHAAKV